MSEAEESIDRANAEIQAEEDQRLGYAPRNWERLGHKAVVDAHITEVEPAPTPENIIKGQE